MLQEEDDNWEELKEGKELAIEKELKMEEMVHNEGIRKKCDSKLVHTMSVPIYDHQRARFGRVLTKIIAMSTTEASGEREGKGECAIQTLAHGQQGFQEFSNFSDVLYGCPRYRALIVHPENENNAIPWPYAICSQ